MKLTNTAQEPVAEQRDPAGPRRLGTETRITRVSAPKALCFFPLSLRPMQKRQSMPSRPLRAEISERTTHAKSSDSAHRLNAPLFARVGRCVRSCGRRQVCARFQA